jgi:hypothetical protein
MLSTKPRGVPRVDDRRVLNGIWVLRSGAPCEFFQRSMVLAPLATIALFVGGGPVSGKASCRALVAAQDVAVQMIDTSAGHHAPMWRDAPRTANLGRMDRLLRRDQIG